MRGHTTSPRSLEVEIFFASMYLGCIPIQLFDPDGRARERVIALNLFAGKGYLEFELKDNLYTEDDDIWIRWKIIIWGTEFSDETKLVSATK